MNEFERDLVEAVVELAAAKERVAELERRVAQHTERVRSVRRMPRLGMVAASAADTVVINTGGVGWHG